MCNINICNSHSCNHTPKKLVTENKAWEHCVLKLNIACVGATPHHSWSGMIDSFNLWESLFICMKKISFTPPPPTFFHEILQKFADLLY